MAVQGKQVSGAEPLIDSRSSATRSALAPLPYPETDIAANTRRAHDVISAAIRDFREIRKALNSPTTDLTEIGHMVGLASNSIGSASHFLRQAIAIRGVGARPRAGMEDLAAK